MLTSLRRSYTQLITSGGQLILLFAGFYFDSPQGWIGCLGLIALISLFAWLSVLGRYRLILGTPTSRIESAAQGFVELRGDATSFSSHILAKYSQQPCLWYRYTVAKKNHKNEWHIEESGESDASFVVDDGSGHCVIHPQAAEIITHHKHTWQVGDRRYTEWKLLERDEIYALGEFKTVGGSTTTITHNELTKQVLLEWKLNNEDLLKRFDLDNNGIVDIDEWMLARQAAKREANKRLAQERAEPNVHYLLKPHDDRLFLLSNLSPEKLARRFIFWAWFHLMTFFSALAGIAWLMRQSAI